MFLKLIIKFLLAIFINYIVNQIDYKQNVTKSCPKNGSLMLSSLNSFSNRIYAENPEIFKIHSRKKTGHVSNNNKEHIRMENHQKKLKV